MNSHPDADLLTRTRAALDVWERAGGGPTSSITGGGAIAALEKAFARQSHCRYALAMPSGSAALRVALSACGVGPGDEVVCSALDWPAASAAARSLGAIVRYADIAPDHWTMDPVSLRSALTAGTRAVVVTHLFGLVADVSALRAITDEVDVPLIEDCAQALGAHTAGVPVGSQGALAAFSFGPGKLVDAFEGGMVTTDDAALFKTAVVASQHPVRQLLTGIPEPVAGSFLLRAHPLSAVIALAELPVMGRRLESQRATAAAIYGRVQSLGTALLPLRRPGVFDAWTHVPALIRPEDRPRLRDIGVSAEWPGSTLLAEACVAPVAAAVHAPLVTLRLSAYPLPPSHHQPAIAGEEPTSRKDPDERLRPPDPAVQGPAASDRPLGRRVCASDQGG